MRVWELQNRFGLDNLALVDRPAPQPGSGQVRVRMRAATLNYRDLLVVEGRYNPKLRLPLIPVSDGAGVVDAVGDGVSRFRPGDYWPATTLGVRRLWAICGAGMERAPPS